MEPEPMYHYIKIAAATATNTSAKRQFRKSCLRYFSKPENQPKMPLSTDRNSAPRSQPNE